MKAKSISPAPLRAVPAPSRIAVYLPWASVLLAVMFAAIVRFRLLQIPLERDEGEYAFAGQLLLQGVPPYREAFNMKFPGIYAAYAAIMAIFGQTIGGIHLGLLLANALTIVLVFLLGRRLFGAAAGAAASVAYALFSLSPDVYGTQAHATHFVVLPALAAYLLLLRAGDTGRLAMLLYSGLLFGVGVLMKQPGVFFAIFGALYLLWTAHRESQGSEAATNVQKADCQSACRLPACPTSPRAPRRFSGLVVQWVPTLRKLAIFAAGVAVPLALTAVALWSAGVFERFWFWTFTYAREYVTETSLFYGMGKFNDTFPRVVGPSILLWIFAAVGLIAIWWKKEDRRVATFATGLLVFSFLAVCPGLYFRGHYFILMLPAVALLAGAGLRSLQRFLGDVMPICLYAGVLLFSVYEQSDFFFQLSPRQACQRMYGSNPFEEAIQIGDYLQKNTAPDARIAILGSEPEIYFYAHRRAVSGYIYTYGMMEPQPYALTMQNEMIKDIETGRPLFIVVFTTGGTWDIRANSSHHIFQWWDTYSAQHYKKTGVVEAVSADQSEYHWGDLESYQPKADVVTVVYRRKD